MNCEKCQSEMPAVYGQSHFYCEPCHSFGFLTSLEQSADRIEPSDQSIDFQCPRCEQNMLIGQLDHTQVCYCDHCCGYVIDTQSLGRVIEQRRQDWQGADDAPIPMNSIELDEPRSCPACSTKMDSHPYYGPGTVVINTCRPCQLTWLDHGELSRIVRAPGVRKPAPLPQGSQVLRDAFYANSIL